MLYKHFTEKILGLQDIKIEKVEETDNSLHIHCHLMRKPHKCPCCNTITDTVHDYRVQVIKDTPALVIVFYISFITNPFITKNKRQLDAIACNVTIRFFGFTPTMDIEPLKIYIVYSLLISRRIRPFPFLRRQLQSKPCFLRA